MLLHRVNLDDTREQSTFHNDRAIAFTHLDVISQFVVSGADFNMTFLLLAIQLVVCVACVSAFKQFGLISLRDFDWQQAKAWFPISFLLVSVIYTGSKSLVSTLTPNPRQSLMYVLAIFEHSSVHNIQEFSHNINRECSGTSGLFLAHILLGIW